MGVQSCPRCETYKTEDSGFCLICRYDFSQPVPAKNERAFSQKNEIPNINRREGAVKKEKPPISAAPSTSSSLIGSIGLTVLSYFFLLISAAALMGNGQYDADERLMILLVALISMILPVPVWGKRMHYPIKKSSKPLKVLWAVPLHIVSVFATISFINYIDYEGVQGVAVILMSLLLYMIFQLPIILSK